MRLFVAVHLPEPMVAQVAGAVDRMRTALDGLGAAGAIRWTRPDQWHVTLRFLGEVEDPEPVVASLEVAPLEVAAAELGPTVGLLGRQVVSIPVAGLDGLADVVRQATASVGEPPEDRAFRGHVTVARVRGRGRGLPRRHRAVVVGTAVAGTWSVGEVALVRSSLGQEGPRYEDLHVRPLGQP